MLCSSLDLVICWIRKKKRHVNMPYYYHFTLAKRNLFYSCFAGYFFAHITFFHLKISPEKPALRDILKVSAVLSLWRHGKVFYQNPSSKLHFISSKLVEGLNVLISFLLSQSLKVDVDKSASQMPKCNINVFFFSVSKKKKKKTTDEPCRSSPSS